MRSASPQQQREQGAPAPERRLLVLLLLLTLSIFGLLQFGQLSSPLLWQDEAETAMFGRRVLEYGYPKVHDGRNVVYGMGVPLSFGVRESSDAYIGSLWGQYYFAALAVRLADLATDLHAKTALLRLPFALAGCLGLWLLYASVRPLLARSGAARRDPWCPLSAFLLLLSLSTSLILHLREVRYYALVVSLLGAIVLLFFRRPEVLESASWRWRAAETLALVLLFNVFYPAAVALAVWIALETALALRSRAVAAREWPRAFVRGAAPALIAGLLFVPIAACFEVAALGRLFSARYEFGPGAYLANCGLLLHYLLRYEWLALVLCLELAILGTRRLAPRPAAIWIGRRRALALLRLCLVWCLVGARNPIFFERYFVPLSPVLALVLLLDALWLRECVRAASVRNAWGGVREARVLRGLALAFALGLLVMLGVKWSEVSGRILEISQPVRGPLDYAIPFVAARYDDPSALVVATNYEAESFMFYLDCRVVGRFHAESAAATARERAARPDVVVPRRGQPRAAGEIAAWLAAGDFERHTFPILDPGYNAIPELFAGRVLRATHRFETATPAAGQDAFALYVRKPAAGRSGLQTGRVSP